MKNKRHTIISEIIEKNNIETQEELQQKLLEYGFTVTQATVSRDIKQLKLVKKLTPDGVYKYAFDESTNSPKGVLFNMVISSDYAMNTVVLKCMAGMAQAVCASLDSMSFDNIIGTLAGDDTIFVLFKTEDEAKAFCGNIANIMK